MRQEPSEPNREFIELLLPNQRALRNFIFSIHPQAQDLDDLMQETCLSLWHKFGTFDPTREFLPWANRLAYFEVLRFRKDRSRSRLVFSDQMVEQLAEEAVHPTGEDRLREALGACLGKLDDKARKVLEARYSQGASIQDLAAARNESPHRLYRILEKSRAALVACVRRQLRQQQDLPFPSPTP
jgi:RNA polymerase sigma-70 factor (ECF subfamily)